MKYDFRSPYIQIKITTVLGVQYELKNSDLSGDFRSLTISKKMADACGSFSFDITARDNLQFIYPLISGAPINTNVNAYEIFQTMTLIDIYINGKEVMLGIVDNCTKNMNIGDDGKPERYFTINGRDLGSFLIDQSIWYFSCPSEQLKKQYENSIINKAYNFSTQKMGLMKTYQILEFVWKKWFTDTLTNVLAPFIFSDGDSILNKITCSNAYGLSIQNYLDEFVATFETWNYEGDIYQYFKTFISSPFNEFFIETGDTDIALNNSTQLVTYLIPKKCHVISRPAPFNDSELGISDVSNNLLDIHDLPENIITDEDIVSKTINSGRNGIQTAFQVFTMTNLVGVTQGAYIQPPVYNISGLQKYGHQMMDIKLQSFDVKTLSDITTNYSLVCSKYSKLLAYWFSLMDQMLTGSFTIKGNESIRIGQKLTYDYTDDGKIEDPYEKGYYYITGITHDYAFGKAFTTKIDVERGTTDKNKQSMKNTLAQIRNL